MERLASQSAEKIGYVTLTNGGTERICESSTTLFAAVMLETQIGRIKSFWKVKNGS